MYNVINNKREVLNVKVYVKKEDKNTIIPGIIAAIMFLSFSVGIFIAFFKSEKSFADALYSYGVELAFAVVFFEFGMYSIYCLFKWPKGYNAKLVNKEINNSYENSQNKVASKVPDVTMTPVFFAIGSIFVVFIFYCILGIIMYPQHTYTYIMCGIFFGAGLFMTFKVSKICKDDNNNDQNEKDLTLEHEKIKDLTLELEKIKPIDNNQEKVGNIVIKYYFILLLVYLIIWFIIMLIMNAPLAAYSVVLFVELPIIVMILYNIGYDERLIRRYKVNISENINIDNIKNFNIFRPSKNASFPQYFIVDQNRNLIFKIKKSDFIVGEKFVICNSHNIKIGEIKSKLFSLTNEFVVNIINEKPFIICSKMQLASNYQVIGRDYYVKGDTSLTRNIIYDNKENDIAYISAVSSHNNNLYELGNTEVILNDNVNNSVDIIIIALCITMGNFH